MDSLQGKQAGSGCDRKYGIDRAGNCRRRSCTYFIWEEFCDWYIEMAKPRFYSEEDQTKVAALWTLKTVLTNALKSCNPQYAFFITEDIFRN